MSSAIEYTLEAQSELGEAGQDYGLPGSRKIEKAQATFLNGKIRGAFDKK